VTWWQILLLMAAAAFGGAVLIYIAFVWIWTDGFRRTGLP